MKASRVVESKGARSLKRSFRLLVATCALFVVAASAVCGNVGLAYADDSPDQELSAQAEAGGAAGSSVTWSENIATDTNWESGLTYTLDADISIKSTASLVIPKGTVVNGNGHKIDVYGSLTISGATLKYVHIRSCNTDNQPCAITIRSSSLTGGSLLNPTGNSAHVKLLLESNRFKSLQRYSYIWYPSGEARIIGNVFEQCGGLSIGSRNDVYVTNNAFHGMTTDYAVESWAQYGNSDCYVEGNSFFDQGIVLGLRSGYSTCSMVATGNYWGTDSEKEIASRISDGNTDYSVSGIILFSPWLSSPAAETPSVKHSYGSWQVTAQPTCTESGTRERKCSVCGSVVTEELPPTGHVWSEEYEVDVPPTNTEEGSESIHCTVCGVSKEGSARAVPRLSDIRSATVSGVSAKTYTGKAITQDPVVKAGSAILEEGVDYTVSYANNTNAGTATLILKGKGFYGGTLEVPFAIEQAESTIQIADQTKEYTGDVQTYSGKTTKTGSAGAVTFAYFLDSECAQPVADAEVKAAGTYYVRATLAADTNYKEAQSSAAVFTIAPTSLVDAAIEVDAQAYTGKAVEPVPTVKVGGVALTAGTDFDISYENNVDLGEASLTITGKGNYKDAATATFEIMEMGPENPFTEVTEDTAHYEDILWLVKTGISTGWDTPTGKEFRPNSAVKRGDMAAFLFRLAKRWGMVGDDWEPSGDQGFVDVNEETSHYKEIVWLAEQGISLGWETPQGAEFRPNSEVKRGDMAAFMHRLARQARRTGAAARKVGFFSDVDGSTAHYDKILWLAGNGVTYGWVEGTVREFRPNATVKRGDMAAFLHRLNGVR